MKQMLGLLFVVAVVLFVTSFDDLIEPYWKNRGSKALALVEEGKYREAIEVLIGEEIDVPERSSSKSHAAPSADDRASSGGPEFEAL